MNGSTGRLHVLSTDLGMDACVGVFVHLCASMHVCMCMCVFVCVCACVKNELRLMAKWTSGRTRWLNSEL